MIRIVEFGVCGIVDLLVYVGVGVDVVLVGEGLVISGDLCVVVVDLVIVGIYLFCLKLVC